MSTSCSGITPPPATRSDRSSAWFTTTTWEAAALSRAARRKQGPGVPWAFDRALSREPVPGRRRAGVSEVQLAPVSRLRRLEPHQCLRGQPRLGRGERPAVRQLVPAPETEVVGAALQLTEAGVSPAYRPHSFQGVRQTGQVLGEKLLLQVDSVSGDHHPPVVLGRVEQ